MPLQSRHRPPGPGPWRRLFRFVTPAVVLLAVTASAAACSGRAEGAQGDGSTTSTRPLAREFEAETTSSTTSTTEAPTTTTTSPFAQPSSDPNIEGFTRELLATPTGGVALSEAQARCVASGMVTRLGLETMARIGSQPGAVSGQLDFNALSPSERETFADALIGCIDLNELLAQQLGPSLGLPPSAIGCVTARLAADGTLADMLRQAVVNGADPARADSLTSPMMAALGLCLTPEQLRQLTAGR
jgi:hypothetical protein